MSTASKIWLIAATALVCIGLIILVSALVRSDGDFSKIGNVQYETNIYEISEEFDNISFDTETADIVFVPSDDGKCKVVCYEQKDIKHSVVVKDNTLTVNVVDNQKWYKNIFVLAFTSPKVTVYLPQAEYTRLRIKENTGGIDIPENFKFESIDISASTGGVKCSAHVSGLMRIKLSTGGIRLENTSAGTLDLTTSTGNITLSSIGCDGDIKIDVTTGKVTVSDTACKNIDVRVTTGKAELTGIKCDELTSRGSTGTIILTDVIADGSMSISRSTGNIRLEKCDAAELSLNTNTGAVKGSLLTDKMFMAHSDTGKVNVPRTSTGGRCEITTNTGNINMEIHP